jgi:hypothetical protein
MPSFMSNVYKYQTHQHLTYDNEQYNTTDFYITMGQCAIQWARSNYSFYGDH